MNLKSYSTKNEKNKLKRNIEFEGNPKATDADGAKPVRSKIDAQVAD